MVQQDIQDAETKPKEEILQEQMEGLKTAGTFGAESTPFLGEIIAAKRTGDAIQEKDYIGAAVEAAAGVLGIVPVVGDAAGRGVRKLRNYNLKDQDSRVFHLTKKNYDAADVVGKGTDDIGFHVGTAQQASARGSSGNPNYSRAMMEDMTKGERVLPMVLKANLKPARIVDLSSFKQPRNWLANLSVDSSDRQIMRFLKGDSADSALLKKAPRVKADGKTYIMSPDAMRAGVDPDLWEDLILEASRARRVGLDTITKQEDRLQWFSTLKGVANKHGYDSFVYKNEYEGIDKFSLDDVSDQAQDSYMLLEADQAKGIFGGLTEGEPEFMKNRGGVISMKKGGVAKQMEMFEPVERGFNSGALVSPEKVDVTIFDFNEIAEDYNESLNRSGRPGAITGEEMSALFDAFLDMKTAAKASGMNEGGLAEEGGSVDPISGNSVPPGSTKEEVRDDIPAQLSEGEFVFPADVVRYIGLEKLMMMRQEAKMGLAAMEAMGQMGNSEEAIMPDNLPFDMYDLEVEDDGLEMNQGGVIQAANGTLATNTNTGTMNPQTNQFQPMGTSPVPPVGGAATPIQAASANVARFDPNLAGTSFQPVTVPAITMPFQQAIGSGVRGVDYTVVSYIDKDGNPVTLHKRKDGTIVDPATNAPVDTEAMGYTLTSDVVQETAAPKAQVQTARVLNQDSAEDKKDTTATATVALGGQSGTGKQKGLRVGDFDIFGVTYDVPGTLPGVAGIFGVTKGLVTGQGLPTTAGVGKPGATATFFDRNNPNASVVVSAEDFNSMKNSGYKGKLAETYRAAVKSVSALREGDYDKSNYDNLTGLTKDLVQRASVKGLMDNVDMTNPQGLVDNLQNLGTGTFNEAVAKLNDAERSVLEDMGVDLDGETFGKGADELDDTIGFGSGRPSAVFDDPSDFEDDAPAPSGPSADTVALSRDSASDNTDNTGSSSSSGMGMSPGAMGGRSSSEQGQVGSEEEGDYGFDGNKGGLAKQMKRSGLASKK